MATAIVTGASRGLGLALARQLSSDGWRLVVDARGAPALRRAAAALAGSEPVHAVAGDVADADHRRALMAAAADLGGIDALVLNASTLGAAPLPALADYPLDALREAFEVNVIASLALVQAAAPLLSPGAVVVSVTSDAAREAYPGWGGYGASKAALEQITAVLAVERPDLRVYAVDPGDMRTQMHADAVPDADLEALPQAEDSVPGLLRLLRGDLPSGRYLAGELAPAVTAR
ncbi:MAG TPA: SDR family oxidoreductase [Egibacteraceae bacterium]|nr:SDR family oxidoreductase [Egibacteraceae bacterium]